MKRALSTSSPPRASSKIPEPSNARPGRDRITRTFLLVTLGLLGLRFMAMKKVGFGDSEALYASYALHPAPAYLDHPGLIGMVASLIGHGGAPTPERAHSVTIAIATIVPWIAYSVARVAGASFRAAIVAGLLVAVTPELSIGLFALTPDLLMAPLWLIALGCAIFALQNKPGDARTSAAWLAAGLIGGVCGTAKISGLLLPLGFVAALTTRPLREHARSPWPWAGLLLGAIVMAPVCEYELHHGFAMVRHRLIETQAGAGPSFRNLGLFFGGQLAYVSPLILVAAFYAARELTRRRWDDPVDTLLFFAWAIPGAVLLSIMLWSKVAEPHWLAPSFLALPIAASRVPVRTPRWLLPFAAALGLVITVFVHVWVLVPEAFKFARPADPKLDISNELYGWDDAEQSIRELLLTDREASAGPTVVAVVGPHWTVCAQIHARLGATVPVGCMTPIRDDFDQWYPRAMWHDADKILYVTDDRFPEEPSKLFPDRAVARSGRSSVYRGGRRVRAFTFTLFEGAARAGL